MAVQTEKLSKEFRQGNQTIVALDSIDLKIEKGEFVAVMGASGSGKSSLLHLIAGLIRPSAGRVCVNQEDLSKMSDQHLTTFRRQKIGLVFQSYNLIPHLTAEENILLPLRADGRKSRLESEKLQAILNELEIVDQLRQYPETLSGGQQQRVALARALSMDPAIILADEPTGNLDSISSQNICRILNRLNREKKRTIALVTHEPSVAIWAQRLLILRDGRIIADLKIDSFEDAQDLAAQYQEIVQLKPNSENI